MSDDFKPRHQRGIQRATTNTKGLPTVGQVLDALKNIDRDVEMSLVFLPAEGGHRGPNALDVPFTVDPVKDDKGQVVVVQLIEN